MKIRNGFVSNSSSSSFYIKKPSENLPFEKISEYYEINPEIPEGERVWMIMCIWKALRLCETPNEDYEENSCDTTDSSVWGLEHYLSEENIKWMERAGVRTKGPDFWEKAKKILDEKDNIICFDLSSTGEYSLDYDFKVPYDDAYEIRYDAEDIFLNPERAIGVRE